jgi:hypothetical protein
MAADRSSRLMPEDKRQRHLEREHSLYVADVAVAQARRLDLHEDLALPGRRGRDFGLPQLTVDLVQYPRLHDSPISACSLAAGGPSPGPSFVAQMTVPPAPAHDPCPEGSASLRSQS